MSEIGKKYLKLTTEIKSFENSGAEKTQIDQSTSAILKFAANLDEDPTTISKTEIDALKKYMDSLENNKNNQIDLKEYLTGVSEIIINKQSVLETIKKKFFKGKKTASQSNQRNLQTSYTVKAGDNPTKILVGVLHSIYPEKSNKELHRIIINKGLTKKLTDNPRGLQIGEHLDLKPVYKELGIDQTSQVNHPISKSKKSTTTDHKLLDKHFTLYSYDKKNGTYDPNLPNIVVLDGAKKDVDLNADGKGDISHKDMVIGVIRGNVDANIYSSDVDNHENLSTSLAHLTKAIKSGDKVDAVNISKSAPIDYSELSKYFKTTITHENVDLYKERIREALLSGKFNNKNTQLGNTGIPSYNSTNNYGNNTESAVRSLEEITSNGVKVFISKDNHKEKFNLLTLAHGTDDIARYDQQGKRIFSDQQIDTVGNGTIAINPLKESNGKAYIDVTYDWKPDIAVNKSPSEKKFKPKITEGNSYLTPERLAQYLKNR